MATPFKQKNFRIPLELAEKLEEKAKQTGLTETEIVIKALEHYLERNSWGKMSPGSRERRGGKQG